MNIDVSVVIPTYNRNKTLIRAVTSALKQNYQNFEIIVIDDASNDGTEKSMRSVNDKKIVYVKHEVNKGGSAARNTGIKLSRGSYIALLDSDDEWLEDKLITQVGLLKKLDNSWGGTYCSYYSICKNDKSFLSRAALEGNLTKQLFLKELNIGASSTLLFRKEVFERIGLFDESFARHQDWEFLVRFFRKYKLAKNDEPLVKVYGPNMPCGEKSAAIKEQFLSTFQNDILSFGDDFAREVLSKHWFEVAVAYAREGNLFKCCLYSKKATTFFPLSIQQWLKLMDIFLRKTLKSLLRGFKYNEKK